ncbi:MAG: hypothetical protein KAX20_08065, partial [Candidatus Omnitrophica bacterium]|nr:hypothetical protein [Candidatus Omnitrophota bacterium]
MMKKSKKEQKVEFTHVESGVVYSVTLMPFGDWISCINTETGKSIPISSRMVKKMKSGHRHFNPEKMEKWKDEQRR